MPETPQILRRRHWLQREVHIASCQGLEIGPYDRPVVTRSLGPVKYLDYYSADDLRKMQRGDRRGDDIVDVDYVSGGVRIPEVVDQSFDYVIASHVVEHVPDLVQWLNDVESILVKGGVLALAVPHKDYTFDLARPLTTTGQVIEEFLAKRQRPSFAQVFDQLRYHRKVDLAEIWRSPDQARANVLAAQPTHNLQEAMQRASLASSHYFDCHCHVFSTSSFRDLIADLNALELIRFRVAAIQDVEKGFNDFLCLLRFN